MNIAENNVRLRSLGLAADPLGMATPPNTKTTSKKRARLTSADYNPKELRRGPPREGRYRGPTQTTTQIAGASDASDISDDEDAEDAEDDSYDWDDSDASGASDEENEENAAPANVAANSLGAINFDDINCDDTLAKIIDMLDETDASDLFGSFKCHTHSSTKRPRKAPRRPRKAPKRTSKQTEGNLVLQLEGMDKNVINQYLKMIHPSLDHTKVACDDGGKVLHIGYQNDKIQAKPNTRNELGDDNRYCNVYLGCYDSREGATVAVAAFNAVLEDKNLPNTFAQKLQELNDQPGADVVRQVLKFLLEKVPLINQYRENELRKLRKNERHERQRCHRSSFKV